MAINPKKLEAALSRSKRVKGVTVPASLDAGIEKLLVTRQTRLWDMSVNAAAKKLPKPTGDAAPMISDIASEAWVSAVNAIYNQYANLGKLKRQLEEQFDKGQMFHRRAFRNAINRAIGVSIDDLLSDKRAKAEVDRRTKDSVSLIKKLDKEMKARLLAEIRDGISKGRDNVNLVKMIKKDGHVSGYRARVIARDQMSKLFGNLSRTRQEDIGVTEYVWSTVGDGAVRSHHAARDGKIFKWSDPPEGGHPGEEVMCRCTAEPVLKTAKIAEAFAAAA